MESIPLLAVTLLFRSKPGGEALHHVIDSVSLYADSSVELPLAKACQFGSVTLLDRIWDSTVDLEPTGRGLWSVRKLLRTYKLYGKLQFTLSLLEAIKVNKVDLVRWLFEHFPDYGVRRNVVYAAAAAGTLEILQYFRANGTTIHSIEEEQEDEGEWDEEKENWHRGRWVRWGALDAAKAALGGHDAVVKWMYETSDHENRNDDCAIDATLILGNMALANWVMDKTKVGPEGHEALFGAAANGHVEVLQWFQERGQYTKWGAGALYKAAQAGQLNAVRWIIDRDWNDDQLGNEIDPDEYYVDFKHGTKARRTFLTCLGGEASLAIHAAAVNGHLDVAKYLRAHIGMPLNDDEQEKESWRLRKRIHELSERLVADYNAEVVSGKTMVVAAEKGFLDVVKWLYTEFYAKPGINLFWIDNEDRHIENYYGGDDGEQPYCSVVDVAAMNGHLEIVQYLIQVGNEEEYARAHKRQRIGEIPGYMPQEDEPDMPVEPGCTVAAMNGAADHGHLDVVRWLHANCSEGCTTAAMDLAAESGHLEMVKWLHTNRSEGCTTEAMDGAACFGHLDVVQWLHEHRSEGCTTTAMDNAASGGHFEILKWLHDNRTEGCTAAALDGAASYGRMYIMRWLHENRSEGCTTLAMDSAAHGGHLRVLRWLFENRSEGFTEMALITATRYAQFETVLILHSIAQQGLAKDVEIMDDEASKAWIFERYREIVRKFWRGNDTDW